MKGLPRVVEVFGAGAGLFLALPLMTLVAVLIKITSSGPVIFVQNRVGRYGKAFTLYKFRSMRADCAGIQVTSNNDTRTTPFGKIIRKAKLDELPELWNVVRGDLSLVGPRPEVPRYVDLENPLWQRVLEVRPGITDPVTLRLRNEEDLLGQQRDPETFYLEILQPWKLRGYVAYLDQRRPGSDLRVIRDTLMAVVAPSRTPPPSIDEIRNRSAWSIRMNGPWR